MHDDAVSCDIVHRKAGFYRLVPRKCKFAMFSFNYKDLGNISIIALIMNRGLSI